MLRPSRSKSQRNVCPATPVPAASHGEAAGERILGFCVAFAQMVSTGKWAVLSRCRGREPRVALTALV